MRKLQRYSYLSEGKDATREMLLSQDGRGRAEILMNLAGYVASSREARKAALKKDANDNSYSNELMWCCKVCQYENHGGREACRFCSAPRGFMPTDPRFVGVKTVEETVRALSESLAVLPKVKRIEASGGRAALAHAIVAGGDETAALLLLKILRDIFERCGGIRSRKEPSSSSLSLPKSQRERSGGGGGSNSKSKREGAAARVESRRRESPQKPWSPSSTVVSERPGAVRSPSVVHKLLKVGIETRKSTASRERRRTRQKAAAPSEAAQDPESAGEHARIRRLEGRAVAETIMQSARQDKIDSLMARIGALAEKVDHFQSGGTSGAGDAARPPPTSAPPPVSAETTAAAELRPIAAADKGRPPSSPQQQQRRQRQRQRQRQGQRRTGEIEQSTIVHDQEALQKGLASVKSQDKLLLPLPKRNSPTPAKRNRRPETPPAQEIMQWLTENGHLHEHDAKEEERFGRRTRNTAGARSRASPINDVASTDYSSDGFSDGRPSPTQPSLADGAVALFVHRHPSLLLRLLDLCGDCRDVARASCVNRQWCDVVSSASHALLKSTVRRDGIPASVRHRYWNHLVRTCSSASASSAAVGRAMDVFDRIRRKRQNGNGGADGAGGDGTGDLYSLLVQTGQGGAWTLQIMTDVRRAFGQVAPHKRTAVCRRIGTLGEPGIAHSAVEARRECLQRIVHSLAAWHPDIGYCQGMDYVTIFIMRALHCCHGSNAPPAKGSVVLAKHEVDVFLLLSALFDSYGTGMLYLPGLEFLQLCVAVFEGLVRERLPALYGHFEEDGLEIGMFAIGWFQTCMLYIEAMPMSTTLHIWDIWIFEKSFKIFFRVGLAILMLAEAELLSGDLEEMMSYLNAFPDETVLRDDVLMPAALSIKLTVRDLRKIEGEVGAAREKAARERAAREKTAQEKAAK